MFALPIGCGGDAPTYAPHARMDTILVAWRRCCFCCSLVGGRRAGLMQSVQLRGRVGQVSRGLAWLRIATRREGYLDWT